jgi:hypothetical protein
MKTSSSVRRTKSYAVSAWIHFWGPLAAAIFAIVMTTTGCSGPTLTSAVYACNVEFRGHTQDAVDRVEACRRGARMAHELTVEMASEVEKLVAVLQNASVFKSQAASDIDFDETGSRIPVGDAQESAILEIKTEVLHRAQSRCQMAFRKKSDGRLACMAGIRNFKARDFEKVFLSSVDVRELQKQLNSVGMTLDSSASHDRKPAAAHH